MLTSEDLTSGKTYVEFHNEFEPVLVVLRSKYLSKAGHQRLSFLDVEEGGTMDYGHYALEDYRYFAVPSTTTPEQLPALFPELYI